MKTDRSPVLVWASGPVPAAREMSDFSATVTGEGEVVLFDNERLTYHTLNKTALAIWQLCDGLRTPRQISDALASIGDALPLQAVEVAVAELNEAGLLDSEPASQRFHITRRQWMQLSAAGAIGGALLPSVQSITAPTSVSAATTCSYSGQCTSNCCANGGNIVPQCANLLHAAYGYPANPSWADLSAFCSLQGLPADVCVAPDGSQSVTHGPHTVNVPFSCK